MLHEVVSILHAYLICGFVQNWGIPQNGNVYADNDDQPWDLWVLNFPTNITNLLNKETVKAQGHSFLGQASKGKFWRTSLAMAENFADDLRPEDLRLPDPSQWAEMPLACSSACMPPQTKRLVQLVQSSST